MNSPDLTEQKRAAAAKSLEQVEGGMCLGLGSGSTAAIMVELLGERVQSGLHIVGIPTSEKTRHLAERCGIPLRDFEHITTVDLTIDGADEVDEKLNLIKGGGGALLREKIVASLSRRLVIIVDSTKLVSTLGAFALPVEVVPFAHRPIARRLEAMGASVTLRSGTGGNPFVTDEGHYILDCAFGQIADPADLAGQLDAMPGVMDHGLFVGMTDELIVGTTSGTRVISALR